LSSGLAPAKLSGETVFLAWHRRKQPRREDGMTGSGAIVGDIGGTNARFAWLDEAGRPVGASTLAVADYPGIVEAVEAFARGRRASRACVAVACPVEEDLIRLTNATWAFSKTAVRERLGLAHFDVINDFTAQALALPHLGPDELVAVGPALPRRPGRPLAVLGPGTGLGVSALIPTDGRWVPISGEGGHVEFAARDEVEWQVHRRFGARYGRVSVERILRGQGLAELHAALAEIEGRSLDVEPTAASVTAAALSGEPAATATVLRFLSILGALAGDLVLTLGAFGGVYLAGGIVPRLLPLVPESPLRASFLAKGRMHGLLEAVPMQIVVAPSPALLGAAAHLGAVRG
jgi:glucokinase